MYNKKYLYIYICIIMCVYKYIHIYILRDSCCPYPLATLRNPAASRRYMMCFKTFSPQIWLVVSTKPKQ